MKTRQRIMQLIHKIVETVQRRRTALLVCSAIVVFITTYALILPAFTLDRDNAANQGGIDISSVSRTDAEEASDQDLPATDTSDNIDSVSGKVADKNNNGSEGVRKIDLGNAVVSAADGSKLPGDVRGHADVIDGAKAIKSVEKKFNDLGDDTKFEVFDISLDNVDEEDYENGFEVEVTLPETIEGRDFRLFHIHDGSVEELPIETNSKSSSGSTSETEDITGFTFQTDGFSQFVLSYTVDFTYDVNGQKYTFDIDGADSISLKELVETLHIYESGSYTLDEFMEEVDSVSFSNEELLLPVKIDEDTTAGKIKTRLKLFPTYPLGLKQSEVLALNDKEYSAGDWALISLKPFDTQETLTITLSNGDSFEVLVTDAQDAVMNGNEVQTITNPAGTTIDLFDYWVVSQELIGREGWEDLNQSWGEHEDKDGLNGSGNNQGINSSTKDTEHGHALKFSPAWAGTVYNGTKKGDSGDPWTSLNKDMRNGLNSYTGDGQTWNWNCPNPFPGIVQNNLSSGYPILTNNDEIGTNGESLAYLFDPSIDHSGKASYSGADHLFYVDKEGYYTYDSRDYAASFNTSDKTFTLTEQTSDNSEIRGFWPFGTQNFWVGMHVNTQFSMPTGGKVLNPSGEYKPMQFEFSGDDDVWIYVDGILIGDAGGIHNRTEVDINFETGVVSVSNSEDKYLDDLFRIGLKDQGKTDAEIEEYIAANFNGHTFKDGSYHTFDFFYLERGGGESNLYIHYNLVSTADFSAHKSYYGYDDTDILARDQFKFELVGLDGKYHSVKNSETGNYELVQVDTTSDAIMPQANAGGDGTVASPYYEDNVTTAISTGNVNSQIYITGVTEDGNVNFGSAVISQQDMSDADKGQSPVYRYIIREIVPDDAVNADGITWKDASEDQRNAGGFVKDQITYDGTIYYMTGRVTSWTETDATGKDVVRYGISKTYYTDDTYTTVKSDTNFASFENRFTHEYGDVEFTKVDGSGDPLQGAVFTLYTDETCLNPAKDIDTEGQPVWTASSDANGTIKFENVRTGTYYMKETTAPNGYELDKTVYKVVIENKNNTSKSSKITILGDNEETPVDEITNSRAGELSVIKKWLNANGTEIDGGNNSVTVWLKRKHMVAEESEPESHNITITQSVINEWNGNKQEYLTPTSKVITGDAVVIEWYDEWQDNFDWTLSVGSTTYNGSVRDANTITGPNYTIEKISVDGRSRRLTITNIDGDVSFITKYYTSWLFTDENHQKNLNSPYIKTSDIIINYLVADDDDFNSENNTQNLSPTDKWSHTWTIGGTETDHNGFDLPATDDNGKEYLYYIVELNDQGNAIEIGESPTNGFVLNGYSANNNVGVSDQGVIMVYNQKDTPTTIDVVIKKSDDAEGSTNYLEGAVFRLEYRADSTGIYTVVSKEVVPELDDNGQFTVPAAGIILTGLIDGQYRLEEISPPTGYVITEKYPVIFTVSGGVITGTDGTITGVKYEAATENSNAVFMVPNTPGAELPSTGGTGTAAFYVVGTILMIGAATLLVSKRRRRT